jgi:hypothetical protein
MRRPRFALVLVAILLPVVALLLLLGRGREPQAPAPPTIIGSGPSRSCATATARARVTVKAPVSAVARVVQPIAVTETATGSRGTVAVTRTQAVVEQASASRVVSLDRLESVKRRACARGPTAEAARGESFRRAYAVALGVARNHASASAGRRIKDLVTKLQPGELARAKRTAQNRATAATPGVQASLKRQALAAARARAG